MEELEVVLVALAERREFGTGLHSRAVQELVALADELTRLAVDVNGAIFHSDPGSATRYQDLCRRLGVVQSMGRVGCALDNAATGSATYERHMIEKRQASSALLRSVMA